MKVDCVHEDTLTARDYVELNKDNKLLMSYNQDLLKENQSLKKQLEDMTLCRDIASGHRKEVQDREIILLNQQKEFIDYLENEIRETTTTLERLSDTNSCRIPNLQLKNKLFKKILTKYKEVIGGKE